MEMVHQEIDFGDTFADTKILMVDDEINILKAFVRVLADTFFTPITAGNAGQALELFEKNNIAVVISDNMMPGMNGVEFLSRVKQKSPDTVRILLTGYANLETAIDAINQGEVFRFLVKPWNDQALTKTIKEAYDRFQLLKSLKKSDEPTFLSLAQTIELKDPYTRGHCDNVARYSLEIAKALGLDETMQTHIKHGSWLHDCGKIGVPGVILNKEGKLTEEEFEIIKKHPQWGADVARQAQLDDIVVNIIFYHHEKYGGRGYPTGISGTDIPLEARIVAVADVFDALTTDRSYRKAHSLKEGGRIIESLKEIHLQAELVDILLAEIGSGLMG